MKNLFLFFVLIFSAFCVHGATADFHWAKKFGSWGDNSNSIVNDASGNIIIAGTFQNMLDADPGPAVSMLYPSGTRDVFVIKLDSSGNFIWGKCFGGGLSCEAVQIAVDGAGNVYTAGTFGGTVDFDPGPATAFLTTPQTDVFVCKLDNSGNFAWAKNLPSTCFSFNVDSGGGVYVAGSFIDTVDIDPGAGTFNLISAGYNVDMFLLKLDSAGDFIWAKQTYHDPNLFITSIEPSALKLDGSGNIIIAGANDNEFDFDPGSLVSPPQFIGASDNNFVVKYDANGNFMWVREFRYYTDFSVLNIDVDGNGNIYGAANSNSNVQFGPNWSAFNLTYSSSQESIFYLKYNESGSLLWTKQIEQATDGAKTGIIVDGNVGVILASSFAGWVDFDANAGISSIYGGNLSQSNESGYILKVDTSGNFIWAINTGEGGHNRNKALSISNSGTLFVWGDFYNNVDFDPTSNNFYLNGSGTALLKYSQDSCSNFYVSVNSITPLSCPGVLGTIDVAANNGIPPISYQWSTAQTTPAITVNAPGLYTLTATDGFGCNAATTFLMNGVSYPNGFDLNTNFYNTHFTFQSQSPIGVDAFNDGCIQQSGSLKLVLDANLNYINASPLPDQIMGDTLMWNFSNIDFNSNHLTPLVHVIPTGNLGDSVCVTSIVVPDGGDADPTNNTKTICKLISGPYDPNDKMVYPTGACAEGYILPNTKLTYTINFQNTGTADAENIYVLDSLDANLDISTLKVLSSSHSMFTEVLPGNTLKFRYDNIYLPDSNTDETASHGYVIYQIDHMSNLVMGSQIKNSSEIYFDNNPAIITNQVINTVVSAIPTCTNSLTNLQRLNLNIFPNPANEYFNFETNVDGLLEICDMTGRVFRSQKLNKGNTTISLADVVAGVYSYRFYDNKKLLKTGKLVVVK